MTFAPAGTAPTVLSAGGPVSVTPSDAPSVNDPIPSFPSSETVPPAALPSLSAVFLDNFTGAFGIFATHFGFVVEIFVKVPPACEGFCFLV